ncbi:hypothetical protein Droror1_Dr00023993 [Drosera rotundifolia]
MKKSTQSWFTKRRTYSFSDMKLNLMPKRVIQPSPPHYDISLSRYSFQKPLSAKENLFCAISISLACFFLSMRQTAIHKHVLKTYMNCLLVEKSLASFRLTTSQFSFVVYCQRFLMVIDAMGGVHVDPPSKRAPPHVSSKRLIVCTSKVIPYAILSNQIQPVYLHNHRLYLHIAQKPAQSLVSQLYFDRHRSPRHTSTKYAYPRCASLDSTCLRYSANNLTCENPEPSRSDAAMIGFEQIQTWFTFPDTRTNVFGLEFAQGTSSKLATTGRTSFVACPREHIFQPQVDQ